MSATETDKGSNGTAEAAKAVSKSQWIKAATHEGVLLPSGARVSIRLPNIPALVKAGALPNELLEIATKAATNEQIPDDLFEKLDDFNRWLVAHTVVKPEITEEEVDQIPAEDIEMIVGFATRTSDLDAEGHHLAGLERLESFRKFRGLDFSDTGVLGV